MGVVWVAVAAATFVSCGDDSAGTDAGAPDTGRRDAASNDGGGDGGGGTDASTGPTCDATMDQVYETPAGLPPFTEAERGRVVRCSEQTMSASDVRSRAMERGWTGAMLASGARVVTFSYRTTRPNGDGALASAALYLPDAPHATPMPLVVYGHPTSGMGDVCAPSRARIVDLEKMVYPLVGTGHAVVVPDYTGLGTEGTPPWEVANDEAYSVLDAARAALALAPAGTLSGDVMLSGHSQGGHAAMAAQALQRTYAPELHVVGVAALAPVWFDTADFGTLLFFSNYPTTEPMGWNVVYGALYFIGHSASLDGEAHAYDTIDASHRDAVRNWLETTCIDDLRPRLEPIAASVGQLFDPAFRTSVGDCVTFSDCDAVGTTWQARFRDDRPALDPMGAPVWMLLGADDIRVRPGTMACAADEIRSAGVTLETCDFDATDHNSLPLHSATWVASWVDALASGGPAPAGCGDIPTPPCNLTTDGGTPDGGIPDGSVPDGG